MIELLPRELQQEIERYKRENYPSIGATPAYKGTYLEWLDRPQRLNIQRYLTPQCDFEIEVVFPERKRYVWRVAVDLRGGTWRDEWIFSPKFVTSAQIRDFLWKISMDKDAKLEIFLESSLFYSKGFIRHDYGRPIIVPYCYELHDALIAVAEYYRAFEARTRRRLVRGKHRGW